jgi:DinB family protein
MDTNDLKALRKRLVSAIHGDESHITFDKAIKDFPKELRGAKPEGVPHSAWELLEHMRITQRDILEFSRDPQHTSPKFPEGYWPESDTPQSDEEWNESVTAFKQDERELTSLVERDDLFTPFPYGQGQTLLREALLVANHSSYQLGQVVFLKRILAGTA